MTTINKSILINKPLDKVFNYICDPKNMLEWHPNITKIHNVAGKGEDYRWGWNYKMMGVPFTGNGRILSKIDNIELRIENTGDIKSSWIFSFTPQAGGTRLNFDIDYTIPTQVLDRVGEFLALKRNDRMTEMALANIKGIMES